MSSSIWNTLFGPLTEPNWCKYFQILSALSLLLTFVSFGLLIVAATQKGDKAAATAYTGAFGIGQFGVLYFVNRLLYTMCTRSVK